MKNAAKCDKQCELQNRESSDFWTQVAAASAVMFVSVCPVNYIMEFNVIEAILSQNMDQCQWRLQTKQSLTGDNRLRIWFGQSLFKNILSIMAPEISKSTRWT